MATSNASGGPSNDPSGFSSAGMGPNPISTEHPSILPLRLEGGRVVHGAAPRAGPGGAAAASQGVLMDRMAGSLAASARDSPPNGLVFGVSSNKGAVSQLDIVVGSVSVGPVCLSVDLR